MAWQKYKSHKIVTAAKIIAISADGKTVLVEGDEEFQTTVPGMMEQVVVGGYAVVYEDGFKSFSPHETFEEGYELDV